MRTPPLSYMSVDISEGGWGWYSVVLRLCGICTGEGEGGDGGGVSCCFVSFI